MTTRLCCGSRGGRRDGRDRRSLTLLFTLSLVAALSWGCSANDTASATPAQPSSDAGREADLLPRPPAWSPAWTHQRLSDTYVAEGAAFGDLNGDGAVDLIAGPQWFAGPRWELGGSIVETAPLDFRTSYSTFLLTFVGDVNSDGRDDVLAIGYPGTEARWYENPKGATGPWRAHTIHPAAGGESATYVDLVGGLEKEVVFIGHGTLGYAAPGPDPTAPWLFHAISTPSTAYVPVFHGMGVGDVDGDGLTDVLEPGGWWRQLRGASEPGWEYHPTRFAPRGAIGGGQMLVFDVDGDGDSDVVTSLNAHGYGLSWFEQISAATGRAVDFTEHEILPDGPAPDNFSELHALSTSDLNGDGLPDVVTGRRYYAHDHGDPALADPAVLFWFELSRADGRVAFIPHRIDEHSGVGCVFVTGDVDGDQRPDIFITNKTGTHLFTQAFAASDRQ